MPLFIVLLFLFLFNFPDAAIPPKAKDIWLFNGKNFKGWQGDTVHTWRIAEGALVGGSLTEKVPHNEFIATTKEYNNYILQLKFKLTGSDGFINGGVQFHSQRIAQPPYEMIGYQADIGEGYWGCLYDESRRNQLLATANPALIKQLLRPNDWNDYQIQTQDGRIQIKLNGQTTVDYTETLPDIPQRGRIALQIHGGGKAQVHYKDIVLKALPASGKRRRNR